MIEFVVKGIPRSQQADSASKKQWQEEVRNAAPNLTTLLDGPLRVRIAFVFDGATDIDTDNIIKPIQDALEGTLYEDDEIVVDVCARKIDRQHVPSLSPVPTLILRALGKGYRAFVFVQVASAQSGLVLA